MDSAIFHELTAAELEDLIDDAKSVLKDKRESSIKSEEEEYRVIYKDYIGKYFKLVDSCNSDYFLCFSILEVQSEERDYRGRFDPCYTSRQLSMNAEGFAIDFNCVNLSSLLTQDPEYHCVEITEEEYTSLVNSAFDKAKERESTLCNTLKE